MSEIQKFIVALTTTAISNWADGTETPLFPKNEDTNKYRANMIWHMALNAMAYGYERGLARGIQAAEHEE